ncbi:ADP-ribosylation [Karstenula rhodostoma CBS 690.94]|uniref:ADP-ribosylation n=1 Tax=Karstenula rhodostoma CBS 690.94 TaxID=1392251 RepID=A0A9P4PSR7_9PLEO|nr:ADP-ribosylation [Karstenula rhodostoma CBS 690.94]
MLALARDHEPKVHLHRPDNILITKPTERYTSETSNTYYSLLIPVESGVGVVFWHNSLLLLGILAAFGNAAPVFSIQKGLTAPENLTHLTESIKQEHPLDRRGKPKKPPAGTAVTPKEIVAADGFRPKGELIGKFDLSLWKHTHGTVVDGLGTGNDNDGYVSKSSSFKFVEKWLRYELKGHGMIYKIAAYPNLIDVQATLGKYYHLPHEKEFAAIHSITFDQIRGAQYNLAGFPDDFRAWKKDPWILYSYCRPHNARDLFVGDKPLQSPAPGTALVTRARARKSRPSGKKTSATRKHNRAKKMPKTTRPKAGVPTDKKPRTRCSAAMKKTGKCRTTKPQTKCTAAMKMKGRCKDDKKGKCGPIKSSTEAYHEYVKLLQAGKPPLPGAPPTDGGKGSNKGSKKGSSKKPGGRA